MTATKIPESCPGGNISPFSSSFRKMSSPRSRSPTERVSPGEGRRSGRIGQGVRETKSVCEREGKKKKGGTVKVKAGGKPPHVAY
jgi:hypothetical protein